MMDSTMMRVNIPPGNGAGIGAAGQLDEVMERLLDCLRPSNRPGARLAALLATTPPGDGAPAVQYLERALECARSGLSIAAWLWTNRAAAELDDNTNGDGVAL